MTVYDNVTLCAHSLCTRSVRAIQKVTMRSDAVRSLRMGWGSEVWAAQTSIYASAIGAFLFVAVDWLEPNRRLAVIFKCALIAAGAAVIANRLLPWWW